MNRLRRSAAMLSTRCLVLFSILLATMPTLAQDIEQGKTLFERNCISCHGVTSALVGPALKGTTERHEKEWLYAWIRNAQAMIASGDENAVKLWEEHDKKAMTAFPSLTDDDIENILAYVEADEPAALTGTGTSGNADQDVSQQSGASNMMLFGLIFVLVVALIAILVLGRVVRLLHRIILNQDRLEGTVDSRSQKDTALITETKELGMIRLIGRKMEKPTRNENGQAGIDCGEHWQHFENGNYAQQIPRRTGNEVYAVYYDYESDHTQDYRYFIGCPVELDSETPAHLDTLTLPAGSYLKITAKGEMPDCVADSWREIWASKLPRGYRFDFEVYDQRSADWEKAEVDIYLSC